MRQRAYQREGARLQFRKRIVRGVLMLFGGISYAAFLFLTSGSGSTHKTHAANARSPFGTIASCERSSAKLSLSSIPRACENVRTRKTPADVYFEKYGTIPKPRIMHVTLDSSAQNKSSDKNILVIGDVHGCFEELKLLHETAVTENGGMPFRYVILVGDLCMKGPDSAKVSLAFFCCVGIYVLCSFPNFSCVKVIRYVREQPNWYAVRGNNDNKALEAALGDSARRKIKNYKWVMEGERGRPSTDRITLSDDDVMWLSELPYTITISWGLLKIDSNSDEELMDVTIVHAGLLPGLPLKDQSIETMVMIRQVDPIYSEDHAYSGKPSYAQHGIEKDLENGVRGDPVPWASVWNGPQQIIFGHDAKRGLQMYETKWATGLDTGAVYGRQLTGIILPERQLVQIDTF